MSAVQETGGSRHNGGPIKGPASSVIIRGGFRGPSIGSPWFRETLVPRKRSCFPGQKKTLDAVDFLFWFVIVHSKSAIHLVATWSFIFPFVFFVPNSQGIEPFVFFTPNSQGIEPFELWDPQHVYEILSQREQPTFKSITHNFPIFIFWDMVDFVVKTLSELPDN